MNATATEIRPVERLIGEYAESHRHPTNVLIHWICVPTITFCTIALAYAIHPWLSYAGSAAAIAYYLSLSPAFALVMAVFTGLSVWSATVMPHPALVAGVLFVLTWIAQFVGHAIEGKRPSFLKDLTFLLVGPVFLLAKAFRRFGLRF
jgi:uncharacterized membrane protein YGL010W